MHGGQAAQQEAIAPELNAANAQQQQQRQALSSGGTARGGGINAAEQAGADLGTRTAVNALTALEPQAARAGGQLGIAETGEGLRAAQEQGTLAEAERRTNLQHQAAEGGDVAKGIGALADAFAPQPTGPAFPGMTPGQVSGSFGGPTSVPIEEEPLPENIDYLQALQ